jgi:hypothetical protein
MAGASGQDAAGDADSIGADSLGAASLGAASLGAATLGATVGAVVAPGAGVQAMSAAPMATVNSRRLNMSVLLGDRGSHGSFGVAAGR